MTLHGKKYECIEPQTINHIVEFMAVILYRIFRSATYTADARKEALPSISRIRVARAINQCVLP